MQSQEHQRIESWRWKACHSFLIVSVCLPICQGGKSDARCNEVGGMEMHLLFIVHVPLELLGHSPWEVDMIENLDPIRCLRFWLELLILFFYPCLQLFVGLRSDVFCASIHCNEEEILKVASIEVTGIIVCIAHSFSVWCCPWWNDERAILPLGMPAALVWNAGWGRTQKPKSDSFCCQFIQHNSTYQKSSLNIWLWSFHYFLTYQIKTQSITAQSCPRSPPKSSLMQQKALKSFLKQEMNFSTGDGSWLLVHCVKCAACFETKLIISKWCQQALTQSICCEHCIS